MDNLNLLNALKTGSLYLFLGQNYLEKYLGKDGFLKAIKDNYLNNNINEDGYSLLKNINSSLDVNSALAWMKEKSDRIAVPDQLDVIAKLAWNGVITSSFDTIVARAFSNNWRDVYEVTSYKRKSIELFTSKTKLNISMLFGNVNQDIDGEYPPFDTIEFTVAIDKAKKLLEFYSPDIISPYGVIIIDGYNPEKDWMKPEHLYSVFRKLSKEQVHYFGVKKPITDIFLKRLVEDGVIVSHVESFCEFLLNLSSSGLIDLDNTVTENFGIQKRLMINGISKTIPKNVYNLISEDAIVLDDLILLPNEKLEKHEEVDLFRQFLYQSNMKPFWDGYKFEFNLKRSYETEFFELINKEICKDYDLTPVVLHGQSGSSKSVSMANAAYKLKCKGKYPILFIPKMQKEIDMNNINNFCKWCEDNNADKVIIFWDASFTKGDISRCIEMNNYLVSKGRKVLIICSSYKMSETKKYAASFIEASPFLDKYEKIDLIDLFTKFTERKSELENLLNYDNLDNILLILYRLLPASRKSIRTGIIKEAQTTEITLKNLLKVTVEGKDVTALEMAFLNAGVFVPKRLFENIEIETDLQNIVNLVCIPSQFNIKIPLELVFRTLKIPYDVDVASLIDEIDFLTVSQNLSGIWEIGARNHVEAEIVVKSHLSTIEQQVDLILRLIDNIKSCDFYESKSELDFIVELLKEIGPNGTTSTYSQHYFDIAKKIGDIRLLYGIYNSRTILQESSYLREFVKLSTNVAGNEKINELKKAEKTLKDEIEEIESRRKISEIQLKGYLMVELASNFGAQIKELCKQNSPNIATIIAIFNKLDSIVKKTQNHLPKTLYAIDVLVWASAEITKLNINQDQKANIYSNLLFVFDLVEFSDLGISNMEELITLRLKASELFGDIKLANESFEKLIEQGSSKGIYLRAKMMLESINLNALMDEDSINECRKILEFLQNYNEIISSDIRCLYMVLKLTWITDSSQPMFYKEKVCLPFSQKIWGEILDITEKIVSLSNEGVNAYLLYLQAIAYFHLNRLTDSLETFKKIRDDFFVGSRRIILSYLASESNGDSKKYSGRLRYLQDKKAVIYVNELRKEIPYYNKNFVQQNPALDSTYNGFGIGFNFLGLQITNIYGDGGQN